MLLLTLFRAFCALRRPVCAPFKPSSARTVNDLTGRAKSTKQLAATAVSLDTQVDLTLACDVMLLDSKPGFILGRFCRCVSITKSINIKASAAGVNLFNDLRNSMESLAKVPCACCFRPSGPCLLLVGRPWRCGACIFPQSSDWASTNGGWGCSFVRDRSANWVTGRLGNRRIRRRFRLNTDSSGCPGHLV
ncbi:hypothetical protein B0T21DRAFT_171424 [Apiosordaria backusii]|uniref:Secreted protein n=1 Tax=Apiosordaria backusii TaxID=314023 RepID=A0AA40EHG0_9PEZI|nr:hypothetical protein B0T21DRAFT_171424 [Apiosordaria backusii]